MILKLVAVILTCKILGSSCDSSPSHFSFSNTDVILTGQDATVDLKSFTLQSSTLSVSVDTGSSLELEGDLWASHSSAATYTVGRYSNVSLSGSTDTDVMSVGSNSNVDSRGTTYLTTLKVGDRCTVYSEGRLSGATISLRDGASLVVEKNPSADPLFSIRADASAEIAGEVKITGKLYSDGYVKVDEGSTLKVSGTIYSSGKITVSAGNSLEVAGSVTGGTNIEVRAGKLVISENGKLSGSGTLMAVGDYTLDGEMEVPAGETHLVYPSGVLYKMKSSNPPPRLPDARNLTVVKQAGSVPNQLLLAVNEVVKNSKDFALVMGDSVSSAITGPLHVYGYATLGANQLTGRLTLSNPSDDTRREENRAGLIVSRTSEVNMKPNAVMTVIGEKSSLAVNSNLNLGQKCTLVVRGDAEINTGVSVPDNGSKVIIGKPANSG